MSVLSLISALVIGFLLGVCVMIVWPMFDKPPSVSQLEPRRRMDRAWNGDD